MTYAVPIFVPELQWRQTVSQRLSVVGGGINVVNFGAVGDGVTDDTAAIQAAINAAEAQTPQATVIFPGSTYRCNSALTVALASASNITFLGNSSTLYFPSGSGVAVTYTDAFSSFSVLSMNFTTGTTNAGPAISLTQTVSNANPAVSGINVFQNVTFAGADGYAQTDYWSVCVAITNVSNVTFLSCNFEGPNAIHGKGITLVGDLTHSTYGVAYQCLACNFLSLTVGFEYGSFIQGVIIIGGNFSNGVTGVSIPASRTGTLQGLQIVDAQFGVSGSSIDLETGCGGVTIEGNIFEVFASVVGIKMSANGAVIIGNTFNGQTGADTDGNTGIEITAGGAASIDLNVFGALQTAVKLDSGVANVLVPGGNNYSVIGTTVNNAGTNCFVDYSRIGDRTNNWQTYLGGIRFAANASNVTTLTSGDGMNNVLLLAASDNYYRTPAHHFQNVAGSFTALYVDTTGGTVVVGNAAIATTANDGFLYIPTCAGTPTGTPTAFTGRVAMVYDTTNHKFYIYDGAWKGGTNPGVFT